VLNVFRKMKPRYTPAEVLKHSRALFKGDVLRAIYVTPEDGEAQIADLKLALSAEAKPDASARLVAKSISFDELPAIGAPGEIVSEGPIGLLDVEQIVFSNGARAILWSNDAEPGRVTVKVRFGAGYRAFDAKDVAYAALGEMALVGSGIGELGQEELDRISNGRKMGFDFAIEDAVFSFSAQTRPADVADQLYLFAAKLGMPRWDPNPVTRAKVAAELAYDTYATSPVGVLGRDLDYLIKNKDARFAAPDKAMLADVTPDGFHAVWEPLLKQGPIEIMVFGEFDREEVVQSLRETFGALPPRKAISADVAARVPSFPLADGPPTIIEHRGDANQAAAVLAWPSGGGVAGLRESRQLVILTQVFNNRLMEAMRERAGASYAPQVTADWPVDLAAGGAIIAIAQLKPEDVPEFFAEGQRIANDLVMTAPSADELERATEPLLQSISRASTGNNFWLYHLQGASQDWQRVGLIRSLLGDYSQTTAHKMKLLAQRYFGKRVGWRLGILPEGQRLPEEAMQPVRLPQKVLLPLPVQGR